MNEGGPLEAAVRALVYIAMGHRAVDARSFEALRLILETYPEITPDHYKAVVRRQWAMLVIDEKAALKSLPALLPAEAEARRSLFEKIKAIKTAAGEIDGEAKRRLNVIEGMFISEAEGPPSRVPSRQTTKAKVVESA